jgi:long-chain fatty acid transport protein
MKSLRRCVVGAGAVALATVGGLRTANAAGFANTRIGGEEGTPTSTNPTSLLLNPGAMGFSTGSQLGVYGELLIRHFTWTRSATDAANDPFPDPADAQGANVGKAHLLNVFGGPAIGGTLKLGNLVLGAGFFSPFGGRQHWAQNDEFVDTKAGAKYPYAAAGVQRWFDIDSALTVLYFTAGAAYRFGPLSIGAAGNFISTTLDATRAKDPLGQGVPNTSSEGRAFTDASSYNGSFNAGLMLEAVPNQLWFGASYQSQPGLGEMRLKGIIEIYGGAQTGGTNTYQASVLQTMPDVIRGGVRWKLKHAPLEFRLFGDFTRWSVNKYSCAGVTGDPCNPGASGAAGTLDYNPRNWNNTYGGRLGVSYWVKPEIELLFGAGYETAAVPDATMAPDTADANNIQGTLGARFKLTDSLFLSATYTQAQYFNRDNSGKSTLAEINGMPVPYPAVQEDGGGQYTQWIGYANANLEALF